MNNTQHDDPPTKTSSLPAFPTQGAMPPSAHQSSGNLEYSQHSLFLTFMSKPSQDSSEQSGLNYFKAHCFRFHVHCFQSTHYSECCISGSIALHASSPLQPVNAMQQRLINFTHHRLSCLLPCPWHGKGTEHYLMNENVLELVGTYQSDAHILLSQ